MHPPLIVLPMRKALTHLKRADPVLARLIGEIGPCCIRFIEPGFEALAKAIVYQQLSGKVAATIFGRLAAAASDGRVTPEAVLALDPAKLRELGLSRQKIAYIRDLAERVVGGGIDFTAMERMSDEEVMANLTEVKGIGVWTVHMFLIFALRRTDVMPVGDLGLRAAIRRAYGLEAMPSPAEVEEMARKWRPYCTMASWYLWRSLETDANL
jgi:DNA-3-methyladenine glycosylase II